jgi:uncharacterized RDD family membrane protein YckC
MEAASNLNVLDHLERQNEMDKVYAGFWVRFWAYLLDLIVIASFNRIIVYPIVKVFGLEYVSFSVFSLEGILSSIVFFAYFVLMTKFFNQTLGKMVVGIKVTSAQGLKLTWGTVIFREVIGRFISKSLFGLVYVWVAFSPTKQGVHDFFADTWVIHTRK